MKPAIPSSIEHFLRGSDPLTEKTLVAGQCPDRSYAASAEIERSETTPLMVGDVEKIVSITAGGGYERRQETYPV
jgi:hypothetical protein